MFGKARKIRHAGLRESLVAAVKIVNNNKFEDRSFEGLLLQVSIIRQFIDIFQKTERDLNKILEKTITKEQKN